MGRKQKGAPVVVVRKDKRLNKLAHLTAFALTGGASGIVTAAKAGTNAGYNARTRKLAAQAEADEASASVPTRGRSRRDRRGSVRLGPTEAERAEFRAEHVPGSREYKARHGTS